MAINQTRPTTPGVLAGKTRRPGFGVPGYEITTRGTIVVQKVDPTGSAITAGIAEGDEIFALEGTRLSTLGGRDQIVDYFEQTMGKIGVGGTMRVHFSRGGKTLEVGVVLKASKRKLLNLEEVSEVLERKISP